MSVAQGIEPLYLKNSDLAMKDMTLYQVCQAMARVLGSTKVDGAQRVRNVWRLYLKDKASRAALYVKQNIMIQNRNVQLYDRNPMDVYKKQQTTDKITIRDLPFSVSNEKLKEVLEAQGVSFVSPVKVSSERDERGERLNKLQEWRSFCIYYKDERSSEKEHQSGRA